MRNGEPSVTQVYITTLSMDAQSANDVSLRMVKTTGPTQRVARVREDSDTGSKGWVSIVDTSERFAVRAASNARTQERPQDGSPTGPVVAQALHYACPTLFGKRVMKDTSSDPS